MYSNFIYRNAGWEKGTLEDWRQEDDNGGTIGNYAALANAVTFTTEIKVQSAFVIQFIDSTSACASTSCWLRSEKIPLPDMTAQARVKQGTAKLVWTASECATHYQVLVKQDSRKGARIANQRVSRARYTVTALAPTHSYIWRVRACEDARCGAWSQWRRFSVP